MAERTKIIDSLIIEHSNLFKNTTIIGVFNGDEICSNFMKNYQYLNKITFYENFEFGPSDSVRLKFLAKYKNWEHNILNLKIKIEDGENFDVDQNFIYMTMGILENESIKYKINQNAWSATAGFGTFFPCTYKICKLISSKDIFPIFKIDDNIFFAYNKKRRDEIYSQILPTLNNFTEVVFENYKILEEFNDESYLKKSNVL